MECLDKVRRKSAERRRRAKAGGAARWLALALALGSCSSVVAGIPESGIYVVPYAPNRGAVVEYQNGVVSVMVFAYNERSGEPEWYTASGRLRDDAVSSGIAAEPPLLTQGYYPVHWFRGDLIKAKGGLCAVCWIPYKEPVFEVIGELTLYVDFLGRPTMEVEMDAETEHFMFDQSLKRMNVGYAGLPSGTPSVDLQGEWVFVDKRDLARPAERFRFGPGSFVDRGNEALGVVSPGIIYELTYQDESRGAVLRCRSGFRILPYDVAPNPPGNGCELSVDGQVRFSMLTSDIGQSRIQAFHGPMPLAAGPALRGPLDIVGIRVE